MRSEMRNGSIVLNQPLPVRPDDGKQRIRKESEHAYSFECPGCGAEHTYLTDKTQKPCWDFNGSLNVPTFWASMRVRTRSCPCCHFFVTDGRIAFEKDSTHALAGITVDMPEIPA
jgi:Family of unknown function (DUF6527)